MTALRTARAQARATGQAKVGRCIVAEMSRPYAGPKLKGPELLSALRVREIEALIRRRHGHFVPDARGTDDLEACIAYVKAIAGSLGEVRGWARRWMPWLDDERALIEAEALRSKLHAGRRGPRVLPADAVAKLLYVTMKERTEVGLRTIGACDVPQKQRSAASKARKRQRDRERQQAKRQAEGRTPRAEITATSIESEKPWLTLGISRRAWFYRKKRCTAVSRIRIKDNIGGDTPVQFDRTAVTHPEQSSETNLSPQGEWMGFGDKSPTVFQEAEPHGAGDCRRQAHG